MILQPSATIFNVSMMVVGALVIAGTWFIHSAFGRLSLTIPVLVLGAAALGVGVFPGNTGTPHALCAMATFVSGGVAAIASGVVTRGSFGYLAALLGLVSLLTLVSYMVLGDRSPWAGLGLGGLERWIVYPIVLWIVGFGGHLAGGGARADS